jgi:hypothetical protein
MVTLTFLVGSTGKMMSISAGFNTGTMGTQSGPVRAVVANIAPARIRAVRRTAVVLVDLLEDVLVFMVFMVFSVGLVPLFAAFLSRESDRFQKADSFSIVTCVTLFPWVGRLLLSIVMILVGFAIAMRING